MNSDIKPILRDDLTAKLDRGDDFRLVMTLHDFVFRAARIPGSVHFPSIEEVFAALDPVNQIVVYCSDEVCVASNLAYGALVNRGHTNVRRYSGGLSDWYKAGHALEGEQTS